MAKQVERVRETGEQVGSKEALWRGHVARQPRSGLSIRAYCARHGLSEPSFYFWRAELARRDRGEAKRPARRTAQHPKRLTFLPLSVGAGSLATVEFQLPGGLVIRVPAHDREALSAVWELVKAPPCSV